MVKGHWLYTVNVLAVAKEASARLAATIASPFMAGRSGSGGLRYRYGGGREEREVVALFPSDPIAFLTVELSAYHR